ncbi:MAG: hypothetical protein DMG14_16765 [Acidobacteria bacterium]|nr:MAG: hypothetical protein DMG14_16765 [Acidobacteriota bacterium]
MGNRALRRRNFGSGFASEYADRLTWIQIPVVTSNERLGQKHWILNNTDDREPVGVPRPMFG